MEVIQAAEQKGAFLQAATFQGSREGFEFGTGDLGTGYYTTDGELLQSVLQQDKQPAYVAEGRGSIHFCGTLIQTSVFSCSYIAVAQKTASIMTKHSRAKLLTSRSLTVAKKLAQSSRKA